MDYTMEMIAAYPIITPLTNNAPVSNNSVDGLWFSGNKESNSGGSVSINTVFGGERK
jgi:hypothetical protein